MREEITLHCAIAFPPFWLSRKAGVKNHFFTQKPLYIKWKSRLAENDFEMDRKTEIGQIPQQSKLNSHCSIMLSESLIWLMFAFYFCQLKCWYRFKNDQEAPVKYCQIFFRPRRDRRFDKNGQNPFFLKNIVIFCFNYAIIILWEIFWGALHVSRSKLGNVENSFHICHIFESPQP